MGHSTDWLPGWQDTVTTIATTDHTRAVDRAPVDAGTTILGDGGDSRRLDTVFHRRS